MNALWTSEEADQATGGASTRPWQARGVSIDSRQVVEGDLFIALKGPNHDGHAFVDTALATGAAAAMVERPYAARFPDRPLIAVDDTTRGLEALGIAARARCGARVAAVTGSVGKTGTKEMLALALGRQGLTHASKGNLNNHYGAPLSLARLPRQADFAVFELGMNHAGEIEPLSRMVRPHAAIVTTVEAVHLEFFADETGIADAKAEIFAGIEPGGAALINADNRHADRLAARAAEAGVARILRFGMGDEADIRLLAYVPDATGSRIEADCLGQRIAYRLGAPGRHWAQNSLGVLGMVAALGADPVAAGKALADIRPPQGRGAWEVLALAEGGSLTLIDESYNASPPAVRAAVAVLEAGMPGPGGRRILVLGDMLELGPDGAAIHAALAPDIQSAGIDLVFASGPLSKHLYDALPAAIRGGHASDSAALAPMVTAALKSGDLVCVKGSLGSRMKTVVAAIRDRAGGGR